MKGLLQFLLVFTLCAAASFAQTSKGFIVGTVADPNGAIIPNATVTVTNTATGAVRTTTSQENGNYRIDAVDPGTYNLEVSATGFTSSKSDNIVVNSAQTAEVNLQLTVGGANATVDVTGSDSNVQLQTTDGARVNTLEQRQITELPIAGLNPTALVLTLPGVSDTSQTLAGGFVQGTEFSVNGLRARANNQLIDGLDNNDNSITGQAYQPSVRDGYSEVAILSSNYSAEYGRAGGAITNVVTRSGTNQYRGSAYDIIQNRFLNSLTPGQRRRGLTEVPQFAENTFGGSLGGPIVKNKLFFFGTFQADLYRNNAEATAVIPTAAGFSTLRSLFPTGRNANVDYYLGIIGDNRGATNSGTPVFTVPLNGQNIEFGTVSRVAPQPVNTYDYITRFDYNPTDRDSFTVRYLANKQRYTNQFPTVFTGFEVDVPSFTHNLYTSYTRNFAPNLTNELRFGYGYLNANFTPRTPDISQAGPTISFSGTDLESGIDGVGLDSGFPQGRKFRNYQFQDTATYTISNHTFRIGADLNIQRASQTVPFNSRGTITFTNTEGDPEDPTVPVYSVLENFVNGYTGGSGSINRAFGSPVLFPNTFFQNYFVNDEWKVLKNLTVNLGLRYENYGTPYNKVAFPAFAGFDVPIDTVVRQKADNNNFAPRFSFSYSPDFASGYGRKIFGETATVIRGGFAVSYDVFFNNILGNTAASSPNVRTFQALGTSFADPRGASGAFINQLPTDVPFSPLSPITSIDPNLRNPETYVYNLGIQRRLFQDYILDIAYVGSRGSKLFINEQVNPLINNGTRRLNTSRRSVTLRTNGGDSTYNSLQMRFERGFKNGYLLRGTYTFSKAIDDVNSEVFATTGGTSIGSDPFNRQTDRSVTSYDVPHVGTITGLVNVPTFGTSGIVKRVLNGFTLSGIYRIQSGAVETAYVGGIDLNRDGSSFNDRPALYNLNAPANTVAIRSTLFGIPGTGYVDANGNSIDINNARYVVDRNIRTNLVGRNTLRGPLFQRLDMSLGREFGAGISSLENLRFQLKFDVFNVLNIPNYRPGNGDVLNTLFNDPYTQGEGSGRTGRIQLRLTF